MAKKKAKVVIGICLDESGSMSAVTKETIDSFNEFLNEQRKQKGECVVTITTFSEHYDPKGTTFRSLAENLQVGEVPALTTKNYHPGGNTPLYDAVTYTIGKMSEFLSGVVEKEWTPIVVILTDGFENASRKATRADVFGAIQRLEKEGWAFIYLGANQDDLTADRVGQYMGMSAGSTMSYSYGATGQTVSSLSSAVSATRSAGIGYRPESATLMADIKKEAEDDDAESS